MGCSASSPETPDFHACYALGSVVGTGSFAQTRRVTRVSDGWEGLAKIVDLRTDEHKLVEARNEIVVWRQLAPHVHIIELADVFEDRSFYYLVMDLCAEGFMDHLLAMTQVTELTLAPVLYEVFHALAHVHAAHVIHGDVKPNNFFFKDGFLKLSDFGLSARYVPGDDDRPTGQVGFVTYMSPEMLQGLPYDFKTDVWSAGVITYLLMYGAPPYTANQYSDEFLQSRATMMRQGSKTGSMSLGSMRTSRMRKVEAGDGGGGGESPRKTPSEGMDSTGTADSTPKLKAQERLKIVIKDGRRPPPYKPFNEEEDTEDDARRPPLGTACEAFLHSLLTRDPEKRPAARAVFQLDFLAKPPSADALRAAPCLRPAVRQAAMIVHKQGNSVKQPAAWKSAAKLLMDKQRKAGHKTDFGAGSTHGPKDSTSLNPKDCEEQTALDNVVPTFPPPPPLGQDPSDAEAGGHRSPPPSAAGGEGGARTALDDVVSSDLPPLVVRESSDVELRGNPSTPPPARHGRGQEPITPREDFSLPQFDEAPECINISMLAQPGAGTRTSPEAP